MRSFPLILALGLLLLLRWGLPAQEKPGIAPKRVTVSSPNQPIGTILSDFTKQTGIEIDGSSLDPKTTVPISFEKKPFWNALEEFAQATQSRITTTKSGRVVRLAPKGKVATISTINGPFRVVGKEILIRRDFENDQPTYDLLLEIHWEPRLDVFRITAQPEITKANDDQGTRLTANSTKAFNPVTGYTTTSTVRLKGLTRSSRIINELEGEFTVTATEQSLLFSFADLTVGKSKSLKQEGVKVHLKEIKQDGAYGVVQFDVEYPANGPVFESYEQGYWMRAVSLKVVSPDEKTKTRITTVEPLGTSFIYRFETQKLGLAADWKGWKLEFTTPGQMKDLPIRFQLKQIPLP